MSVRDLFEAEKVRGHRRDGGVKIDSGGFKHYIKNYIYRETDRGGVFGQNAARRYLRARRYSASRPPEARGRACAQAAGASHASCRSGSIYIPAAALVLYIYIYSNSRRISKKLLRALYRHRDTRPRQETTDRDRFREGKETDITKAEKGTGLSGSRDATNQADRARGAFYWCWGCRWCVEEGCCWCCS